MFPLQNISADLVKEFREGSQLAFKQIYDVFKSKIYAFAYSFLEDKTMSEEVVQETFISLWINRARFDENKALDPYLFTISKRLILDNFRKETSAVTLRKKLLLTISEIDNDTENSIILADLMSFAERVISKLPSQQQAVFRLSRFDGLSYDEIAAHLSLSRNTVKNHLTVALRTLKSQLVN